MDIRFISSLTPDDETRLAKALIGAIEKLLDAFPIAYTVRIETSTNAVFDHHHTQIDEIPAQKTGDPSADAKIGPASRLVES